MDTAVSAEDMAKIETELARLRALFPIICEALGNGSCCTSDVGVDFLESIPGEVKSVVDRLRAEAFRLTQIKESYRKRALELSNRAEKAEAALAAERIKVRVLRSTLEQRHTEQGYHRQYVDDVLDATKEAGQ